MKKLSLAYFGTPVFAASFLEKILADKTLPVEVKLLVTQPDRPVGKKQIITPSPVKLIAEKNAIDVATGVASEETLREADFRNDRKSLAEEKYHERQNLLQTLDLVLVCAYGQIIPQELLTLPKYGFWNIHYSLLPKYRGASPVAYALMAGEKKTGATIFQMDEKIDHGPIIAQEELPILPTDRRPDLEKKLTDLAFVMFKKLIKTGVEVEGLPAARMRGISGKRAPTGGKPRQVPFLIKQQNHSLATYTKKLTKQDGFIPFENLIPPLAGKNFPEKIFNLFRGLYPWPGVWTILPNGKRLKITDMNLVRINRVQLEGKKEVDFETFNKAYKVF